VLYGEPFSLSNTSDPRVDFVFSRNKGVPIEAGTKYWLAIIDPSDAPSCATLATYDVRVTGLFGTRSEYSQYYGYFQEVNDVSIWGSKAAYAAAPRGDKKCLFLMVDDLEHVDQKIWFQPEPMCFTKTC